MTHHQVWIGTSWKMNKTIGEASSYVDKLLPELPVPGVQAFIVPPHTALNSVSERVPEGSPLLVGAQNAHWAEEGAGTGEVSMRMIRDAGASFVELGHSERRESFGETDATVSLKVRAAVDANLIPLICIGEPASIRDSGHADSFVAAQLGSALSRLGSDEISKVLVAYEPVWAIGVGGREATGEEIRPVMRVLAEWLDRRSKDTGPLALLYGGSVNQGNCAELLADENTQGVFVGRAAWDVAGYLELLAIGAEHVSTSRAT